VRIVRLTVHFREVARAPGASAAFDLRALRDEGAPDRTGHVLPATADHGQFRWIIIDAQPGTHLVGRVVRRCGARRRATRSR